MQALVSLSLKSSSLLFNLLILIVASRELSLADFGTFTLVLSMSQIGMNVVSVGYGAFTQRELVSLIHNERAREIGHVLGTAILMVLLISLLIVFALGGWALVFGGNILPIEFELNSYLLAICVGLALIEVTTNVMRAYGRPNTAIVYRDVLFRLIFLFLVVLVQFESLESLLQAYIATVFFTLVATLIWCAFHQSRADVPKSEWTPLRERSLGYFWLLVVVTSCLSHVDVVVAGYLLQQQEIGIYAVAKRISLLISFFLLTANFLVAPHITLTYEKGALGELQDQLKKSAAFASAPALFLSLIVLSFSDLVLGIFGSEFKEGELLLVVLVLAQLLNAFFGSTGLALAQLGFVKESFRIKLAALFLTIVLVALGGSVSGALGVAVGYLLGNVIWNVWIVVFLRKQVGVDPTILSWLKR